MDEDRWARLAAVSGVAFVILVVVSGFVAGSPPKPSDSALKIFHYYANHRGSVQFGSFLGGLAVIPGLLWVTALWRRLRTTEPDGRMGVAAVTGLVIAGALATASDAINATTAVRIHDLGPSGARFFLTLTMFMGAAIAFGLVVLVGAVAVASLRSSAFPQWFGLVSAVLAVLWVVAGLASAYAGNGVATLGYIVTAIWAVWILVTVWLLWSSPATPVRTPAVGEVS